MRSLDELVILEDPGINLVREWVRAAINPVELLPCARPDGEQTLVALQVTTRSPLGAMGYETGGLLVDYGWLRILGAGCEQLGRGLAGWNGLCAEGCTARMPGALLVGDDAVGGFFAMNQGALAGPSGNIFYLPPDTLNWEDTELSYTDWLRWSCSGDLEMFYENVRWPGWESDVLQLGGRHGFAFYPFLWAKSLSMAARSRRKVPMEELWEQHAVELRRQLDIS